MKAIRTRKPLRILLSVLVIALVVYLVVMLTLVFMAKQRESRREALMAEGPWGQESLWVDEGATMYLLSRPGEESDDLCDVRAYLLSDGQWLTAEVTTSGASAVVRIDQTDGDPVLDSPAQMRSGQLLLTKVCYFTDPAIGSETSLSFQRIPLPDDPAELPFAALLTEN